MTTPTADTRQLRILVEHSEYWLRNIGDLAMMDVTLRRLRERFPAARIGMLTDVPLLMHAYFPGVDAIDPRGSSAWGPPGLLGRLAQRLGPSVIGPVTITWVTARVWLPQKAQGLKRRSRRLVRRISSLAGVASAAAPADGGSPAAVDRKPSANTLRAASSSSLVLALGGGYVTDLDPQQSTRVLNLLERVQEMGTPTVMLGQGLGPLTDPFLLDRAAAVLPSVDFIALREARKGPDLLQRVGVTQSRFQVTGDDAIELAHALRRPQLGADLGVCLRIAGYSPVSQQARESMASALQLLSNELHAGVVPLFIAEYRSQDRRSTLPLLEGLAERRRPVGRFARPQDVVAQVGQCRVLVTGAYHAAVFALSQGIPVVAITSSAYYDDKFLGLSGMFGSGLQLVRLESGGLEQQLLDAVRSAWEAAPELRPVLLASAAKQIGLSQRGFERACELA